MFLISAGKLIDVANMEASNREHADILGALAERDPQSAARLAVYHAQSLRERFAEQFNGPGAPSAQRSGSVGLVNTNLFHQTAEISVSKGALTMPKCNGTLT